MKNKQVARSVARHLLRLAIAPAVIIARLIVRFSATQEEAEETLEWAKRMEEKK